MMTPTTDSKLNAYRKVNAETRSEPQLIVDLCERAVVAIDRARTASDDAERARELQRAREIVVFLQDGLSMDLGGALAVNLLRHYTWLARQVAEAQAGNDTDMDVLHGKFSELHVTWREAVGIFEQEHQQSDLTPE